MLIKSILISNLIGCILLFSIQSLLGQDVLFGTWQNELGSQLVIDSISTKGEIFGEYRSSSGVDGTVFPLKGWVNQHDSSEVIAIAFSVRWGSYGSITSWTGFIDQDKNSEVYMKVLWHLIRPQEAEPWERIISNSSLFKKVY